MPTKVPFRFDDVPRMQFERAVVRARIREVEGDASTELKLSFTTDAHAPLELEAALLPGTYSLEVDLEERPKGALQTDPRQVRPLHRGEIRIEAGETRRVDVAD